MVKSNKLIVPFVLAAIICSTIMSVAIIGSANLEFHYAAWTRSLTYLPAITEDFKKVYLWCSVLPILTTIFGILILAGGLHRMPIVIAYSVSLLAIGHLFWFFFWIISVYLVNQSFVA